MQIKKFSELTQSELEFLSEIHFNYWVQHNPKMDKATTEHKFKNLYTQQELPFGIALFDNDEIIGFCVFKIENLKKYPHIFPWLSDVMILEKFRGQGYGRKLIELGQIILKQMGFSTIYVWTDQAPDFYKKLGFVYKHEVEKNEGGFGQLFSKKI